MAYTGINKLNRCSRNVNQKKPVGIFPKGFRLNLNKVYSSVDASALVEAPTITPSPAPSPTPTIPVLVADPAPTSTSTPNIPILVAQPAQLSIPSATTASAAPTNSSTALPLVEAPIMPLGGGGGGGGGVVETTDANAGIKMAVPETKGMSKNAKIVLGLLLIAGAYLAYKNRDKIFK